MGEGEEKLAEKSRIKNEPRVIAIIIYCLLLFFFSLKNGN